MVDGSLFLVGGRVLDFLRSNGIDRWTRYHLLFIKMEARFLFDALLFSAQLGEMTINKKKFPRNILLATRNDAVCCYVCLFNVCSSPFRNRRGYDHVWRSLSFGVGCDAI